MEHNPDSTAFKTQFKLAMCFILLNCYEEWALLSHANSYTSLSCFYHLSIDVTGFSLTVPLIEIYATSYMLATMCKRSYLLYCNYFLKVIWVRKLNCFPCVCTNTYAHKFTRVLKHAQNLDCMNDQLKHLFFMLNIQSLWCEDHNSIFWQNKTFARTTMISVS